MAAQPIRYRRHRYRDHLLRTVERLGRKEEIAVAQREGRWGELLNADDRDTWIPSPGARNLTIGEYVGSAARRVQGYGDVEISADVAGSDPTVLQWCRRYAHLQLVPSGALRLARELWEAHSKEELNLPFLPEFDDPDENIRYLAGVEAWRRYLAASMELAVDQRRYAVAVAAASGHSRRSLGRLLDLSYTRVQQLIAAERLEWTKGHEPDGRSRWHASSEERS